MSDELKPQEELKFKNQSGTPFVLLLSHGSRRNELQTTQKKEKKKKKKN
jgi:hypothetical protein